MQLSDQRVSEFRALYQLHFGIALSDTEAKQKALELIEDVILIYKLDYRSYSMGGYEAGGEQRA